MQNNIFHQDQLQNTVAVVGLGKIGLPLAVQYGRHGRRVIGCDINPAVVAKINAGQSHILEEPELVEGVAELVRQGKLIATVDITEAVQQASVVVVIVPVIINQHHEVDFASIDAATTAIGAGLHAGTLVVYETTLPVGTTAKRFGPMLERASGLRAGTDFCLAYSPERVKSGRIFRDLRTYPKVVGGIDRRSVERAAAFYTSVLGASVIEMESTEEAEFVKLIETAYRDVNIALANEFACFADAYGLNVTTAITAANSQPESNIHTPGVGVGGHCIPVYPYFLFASLGENSRYAPGFELPMLVLPRNARRINDAMAEYAVQRIEAITGSLAQQSVLILGIAYRGNVHETAFTSAQLLRDALVEHGVRVYVDDPLFSNEELRAAGYQPLPEGMEGEVKAMILQASHTAYLSFDFSSFSGCQVVLDGRHFLQREMIEDLGMCYITVGDGRHTQPIQLDSVHTILPASRS